VHAAKGLEFTAVFITGLEEGLFPHENSAMETDGLEEERRLMYVAITRAKERLYLSFAQSRMLHGQTRYNIRSRFFDELPQETLKWLTPKVEAGARWGGRSDNAGYGRDFANEQRAAETGFRIGQQVFHTKFGEGTITALEGGGTDAKAQVKFKRHGEKWLALAVAKLQAVE
jgi:DNA helicase-2/ATP-dependent DNA helicase PcrA